MFISEKERLHYANSVDVFLWFFIINNDFLRPLRQLKNKIKPMNELVTVHDRQFQAYIAADRIQARIRELGHQITLDYKGKTPLFLGVLNGSFMFAADLLKSIDTPCEISFVKLQSYKGMSTTGEVQQLIGLTTDLTDRHIIIIEDIIDTGKTLFSFMTDLKAKHRLASVRIASLLVKPEALVTDVKADYCGFEIPNKFVVGYGLDYDGYGRNYPAIYQLANF